MSLGFRAWLSMLLPLLPLISVSTVLGICLNVWTGGSFEQIGIVLPLVVALTVGICAVEAWAYEYDVRSGKCG